MELARQRTRLEEKQETLANMVRMVCQHAYHSVFCISPGGTGKSHIISKITEEEGQEVELFNSHCTALQLYRLLFENRENDKILWFDDCDTMYQGATLGLLRSCLFGSPDRIVTYNSSQLPSDLPARFTTISRFIFCANKLNKNCSMLDAVLSRSLTLRMDLTNSEIIEQFRVMSANGYHGCPPEAAEEIVDFIEEFGAGEKQLSMRLLTPAIRIYRFALQHNTDWRPVLLAQLQNLGRPASSTKRSMNAERDERICRQALKKFPNSTADACRFYQERSSKSRASFYRVLKRVKAEAE